MSHELQPDKVKITDNYTFESLYETFSSLAIGVLSIDTQKNIVFINRAAQSLTGWHEHQAIRQPLDIVLNIIDAKTRKRIDFPFTEEMRNHEMTDFRDCPMLITKSGHEKYISVGWSPIKNEDGLVSGAVINFQDITSYRQVQEKLKIEHNNFRAQFQYAPVGMMIMDEDLVIQSANDYFIDMCRDQYDSVTGKKLGEGLGCVGCKDNSCGDGEECSRCLICESIVQAIKTRIPFRNAEKCFELIRNDKTVFRNLRFNFVPLYGAGKVNILISIDDMTEYRVMEEKIRRSRDFHLALFEEFPALIWRTGADNGIDYVNKKLVNYTGKTFQQELDREWSDNMHPDDANVALELYNEALKKKEPFVYQCRLKRFDGEYRWFDGHASPYFDLEGSFAGYIGVNHDITEQKQIELETRRAMEATKAAYNAKSEFMANMSHEIRTPLNGMLGMIDLTLLTHLTEEQRDNLSTAKACASSLLNIINDVLDFSKMEARKVTIEHSQFDFKSLIEKIVKVHYYRAKEKDVELFCRIPAHLPGFLIGDSNRLQQVLNNLLSNAVKFTDKGAVNLVIKTVSSADHFVKIRFSVADTGIGISKDEMGKLFVSFSQVDGSQTRRHGGTGLGLVISNHLVESMGGSFRVKSKKGKGSVFSFILGFQVGDRNQAAIDGMEEQPVQTTKTDVSILLVEDDKVNQTVISRMLREMGYSFDVADSGSHALKLLEQKQYHICLMDIQMPGLDGIQTAGMIRQKEQWTGKHMPIVAITAYALQGDRERFLEAGMDEYIAKPFHISELFGLLEGLLCGCGQKSGNASDGSVPDKSKADTGISSYNSNHAQEIQPVIADIRSRIDQLRLVIGAGNMEKTEIIAHDIKMLASSISFDKAKTLAFRVQLAARRENRLEADELCQKLDEIMDGCSTTMNERGDWM